jgi:hypothetical protein
VDRAGKVMRSSESVGGAAKEVAFSPDGKWLMSISNGPTLWRVADGSRHLDLRPGKEDAWGAAFMSTADRMALYGADVLRLVDANTGRTIAKTDVPLGPKPSAFVLADGKLAAASEVKTAVVAVPKE